MDWSIERFLVTLDLVIDGFGYVVDFFGTRLGDTVSGFVEVVLPDWILNMTLIDLMLGTGLTIIIGSVLVKFFIGIFT